MEKYKIEGIEFQIYDGLIFLNSQKDDNVVYKKRKYTDAIQHETTSKGVNVKSHCGNPQQIMCSNFRVQILEILCKPYDKEEHERLMQEITKRKPEHKHRDLRSGGEKFYPSDKMGKQLLDHHLVLKRKMEEAVAANNDLKQLNLLRGFFFRLQGVSHEEKKRERNRERGLPVTSVTAEAISEGIIPDHPLAYLRRLDAALPLLGCRFHFW
ncbi:hypothetical protein M9H77_11513 [Catharanthus roseus]|uniref:Uncharacterized protein n=1 Tax=Catharanthus roseus TaxID=4058 RepID=A0ACC0BER2_CATRO|nr:hypothetical protein M9H77_11513 [Catharanthus roseus]